jgi:hypothetical protein
LRVEPTIVVVVVQANYDKVGRIVVKLDIDFFELNMDVDHNSLDKRKVEAMIVG